MYLKHKGGEGDYEFSLDDRLTSVIRDVDVRLRGIL